MEAILLPLLSNLCTTLCSSWFTADAEEPIDEPEKIETFLAMRSVYTPTLCMCGAFTREMERRGRYSRNPSAFSSLHLCSCIIFRYLRLHTVIHSSRFQPSAVPVEPGNSRGFPRLPRSREREKERDTCANTNWNARTSTLTFAQRFIATYRRSSRRSATRWFFFFSRIPAFPPDILFRLVSFGCRTWSERIEFPSGMNSWRQGERERDRERQTSVAMMEPPVTSKVLRAPNLKRGQENVRIQDRVSGIHAIINCYFLALIVSFWRTYILYLYVPKKVRSMCIHRVGQKSLPTKIKI